MRNMYACVYECVYVWQSNKSRETERDSECQGMHLKTSNPYCIYNMTSDILFLKKKKKSTPQ